MIWKKLIYSVEFDYNKGLEFERVVPLSSLSIERQCYVQFLQDGAAKIVIEKVYTLTAIPYEANYLMSKIAGLRKSNSIESISRATE